MRDQSRQGGRIVPTEEWIAYAAAKRALWIPAFAGMTAEGRGVYGSVGAVRDPPVLTTPDEDQTKDNNGGLSLRVGGGTRAADGWMAGANRPAPGISGMEPRRDSWYLLFMPNDSPKPRLTLETLLEEARAFAGAESV